jgi:excisionase family DNA binding protein
MNASQQIPNAVDVSQAAELTGLSKKAIRRRLERGTLGSVKVGGKRMIPISELSNHELLETPQNSGTSVNSHAPSLTGGSEPSIPRATESPMPAAPDESPTAMAHSPDAVAPAAAPNGAAPIPPASPAPAAAQPVPVTAPPSVATPLSPAYAVAAPAGTPGYPPGQPVPGQAPPAYPVPPDGRYPSRGPWSYWYEYPAIRWLVVILAIAIVALLVWLLAIRSTGDSTATVQAGGGPVGATEQDLTTLSQELHQPIYWAGTQSGTRMELTETDSSYAYLRYLTEDSPVGDPSPDFLTVGTYPSLNAYRNLRSYAAHSRANTRRIQNGGLAVVVPGSPTSVYFAYPHEDVQVEVYDPQPQHALDLVRTGVVRPVTTSTTATSTSATPTTVTPTTVTPTTVTPTETTTSAVPTP